MFELAGTTQGWKELRQDLGIATNTTNLYPKEVVLLIGFMLEDSVVAQKVRKLVMNGSGSDDFYIPIVTTPVTIIENTSMGTIAIPNSKMPTIIVEPTVQKEQNNIVVPNNTETNEIVIVENNQAVTTSLQVAETFGKQHAHVLRDIDELLGLSKIGDTPMFHETTYEHPQNKQQYRMFYMNRDGFTLLAMGFTGKKALQFKLKYIEQFNLMEEQLKSQVTVSSYMIDNPIERAKQWIEEQQQTMLLTETVGKQVVVIEEQAEVIEYNQSVIDRFAEEVPVAT